MPFSMTYIIILCYFMAIAGFHYCVMLNLYTMIETR